MKRAGCSLRGVNFGFWSHLGCSGQNAIICSSESVYKARGQKKGICLLEATISGGFWFWFYYHALN